MQAALGAGMTGDPACEDLCSLLEAQEILRKEGAGMESSVYVIFSSTPYRIGSMIRRYTGEPYNHVSIALDPELKEMFSFARRYYRTPLYGGFVKETLSRFCVDGQHAYVQICKLSVTPEQHSALSQRLEHMLAHQDYYLYNHLSALTAGLRRPVVLKGAYTCVEFCVDCLHRLGLPVTPGKYYSLETLRLLLKEHVIYTGYLHDQGDFDPVFYHKQPVTFPLLYTLRDMAALIPRLHK